MTRYARDEFDKVPESASRQGVHRAASAPVRRKLWPILAVGILALAVGLASFLVLPQLGFSQAGGEAAASLETPAPPAATAAASATEAPRTPEPSPSAAAEGSGAGPGGSPSSASPSTAVLDKTQGVAIYNAAGTAGLAGRVGSVVQADGWTLGQLGNWAGAPQQVSVIFYSGPEQKANAEAVSALLGIPTLVDSPEFQAPLVVVLGPDYR